MRREDLNRAWSCRCLLEAGAAAPVLLPHDAMIGEPRGPQSASGPNNGYYECRDYEYTRTLEVTDELAASSVVLECEAIMRESEVYLDDELVAEGHYGYLPVCADLTGRLAAGEHTLRIVAKNATQPSSRWYTGTGPIRPVWLHVGPAAGIVPLYGVRVRTVDAAARTVEVSVQTTCAGSVSLEVAQEGHVLVTATAEATPADAEPWYAVGGEKRCLATATIAVPEARPWSPADPALCTLTVRAGEDVTTQDFGIRELAWDAERGLTINGERVLLKGACVHHDNGLLGGVSLPEVEERRVRLLAECGYNAIRSSHNPASRYFLEACDRQGMLVMDEYVDAWYVHKCKYDYASPEGVTAHWREDFAQWVSFDYDHPSVIMYSTGNEVAETSEERGIALMGDFRDHLHTLDPTRPVTCGVNIFFNFLYSMGMGVYSDEKAEAAPEAPAKKKKAVGSEFYNRLALALGDRFMKWGATLPMSDAKTRDGFANMDMAGYNYGIDRYKGDLRRYPQRLILGTETFMKDAPKFLAIAKDNPRIVGDFVWSGWEYIGETGEGAQEFDTYNLGAEDPSTCMTGGNGRIDLLGSTREDGWWTRVLYAGDAGPHITVMPMGLGGSLNMNSWQGAKRIKSWSFAGCEGTKADIRVYAAGATVELALNGRSLGRKALKDGRAAFSVRYEPGTLTATAYDAAGTELATSSLVTAGEKTELRLTPERGEVAAGEVAFVRISYTDEAGTVKPLEVGALEVEAEGGELLGLGSANPYVRGNYTDTTTMTYLGEAMAIVRATEAGTIRVTVRDGSLEARAVVEAR